MDRRKLLLAAAAIVAALGAVLVFLYVRGADVRAQEAYDTRDILKVVTQIEAGESIEDAAASGKIALAPVPANQVLADALDSTTTLTGKVAVTRISSGEQIVSSKFGGAAENTALQITKGDMAISINLSDPARVAGFVNPGSEVTIFLNGTEQATQETFTRMLLPRVTVLGVGSTTLVSTTTTTGEGAAVTEQLPRTLLTLSLPQNEAERVLFASRNGELAFGLLNSDSDVGPNSGVTAQNLF
ncbi:MAG: Flp pilus assembly protein CpaB [Nocardioides sp.]